MDDYLLLFGRRLDFVVVVVHCLVTLSKDRGRIASIVWFEVVTGLPLPIFLFFPVKCATCSYVGQRFYNPFIASSLFWMKVLQTVNFWCCRSTNYYCIWFGVIDWDLLLLVIHLLFNSGKLTLACFNVIKKIAVVVTSIDLAQAFPPIHKLIIKFLLVKFDSRIWRKLATSWLEIFGFRESLAATLPHPFHDCIIGSCILCIFIVVWFFSVTW